MTVVTQDSKYFHPILKKLLVKQSNCIVFKNEGDESDDK